MLLTTPDRWSASRKTPPHGTARSFSSILSRAIGIDCPHGVRTPGTGEPTPRPAAHTLAARSTDLFEGARDKLRDFVGAASSREIVFLRGTREAIHLVASSYGKAHIGPGDEIIVTRIEHHARPPARNRPKRRMVAC